MNGHQLEVLLITEWEVTLVFDVSSKSGSYADTLEAVRRLSEGKCHFVKCKKPTPPPAQELSRILRLKRFLERRSRWRAYKLVESYRGKEEWPILRLIFLSCSWDLPSLTLERQGQNENSS
jgi:hypothetical protein